MLLPCTPSPLANVRVTVIPYNCCRRLNCNCLTGTRYNTRYNFGRIHTSVDSLLIGVTRANTNCSCCCNRCLWPRTTFIVFRCEQLITSSSADGWILYYRCINHACYVLRNDSGLGCFHQCCAGAAVLYLCTRDEGGWNVVCNSGRLQNGPLYLGDYDLLTLRRYDDFLMMCRCICGGLGLQDYDSLGWSALLLRRLRNQHCLRLTLDECGLWLRYDIVRLTLSTTSRENVLAWLRTAGY